LMPDAMNRTD